MGPSRTILVAPATDGLLQRHRVIDARPLVRVELPALRPRADGHPGPVDGAAPLLQLFGSDDKAEGMAASLEKRPPAWKGR